MAGAREQVSSTVVSFGTTVAGGWRAGRFIWHDRCGWVARRSFHLARPSRVGGAPVVSFGTTVAGGWRAGRFIWHDRRGWVARRLFHLVRPSRVGGAPVVS